MKIHLLSDLHLEFQDFQPPETDADVVVLAGDIHLKQHGVRWAQKHFKKPVLMVAGNHEFYGNSLSRTIRKLKEAAAGSNVQVLHDEAVVLDGVRFLGGTLWTDYRLTGNQPLAELDAMSRLTDFSRIRDDRYRKIRPHQLLERHAATKHFLEESFEQAFNGPTVVITHHSPTELSIHPRFKDEKTHLSASYASRLEHLFGVPKLWVHGHTHDNLDTELYGTRIVCNPRGYLPVEPNSEFQPELVLEV
ncbi:metallophosphoesterase [Nostoc sp. CHAB 5834]|nr:metallophosphoesterase [Nostoc sp. CHAB 5834]